MQLEETPVVLRKLTASEGKTIISIEKDENGFPVAITKELYLGNVDSPDNYEEITDEEAEALQQEIEDFNERQNESINEEIKEITEEE